MIIHSCSFFKQYLKSLAISIIIYIEYSVLLFYILSKVRPTFGGRVCVCVGGGGCLALNENLQKQNDKDDDVQMFLLILT